MTDDVHQRYESVMNMPGGAQDNEGFLETTRFPDEATVEITRNLSQ